MSSIDNPADFHEPTPEYQNLLTIQLEEITETGAIDSMNVMDVTAKSDAPKEDVENKVRGELKDQNWWLQEYWTEKGVPQEQIVVETPVGNLEIFNYGELLEQRHLDELSSVVAIMLSMNKGQISQNVSYILIDNQQLRNTNTGEALNGKGPIREKAIKLYPNGIKFSPHRIPNASNFAGTLIHELTHTLLQGLPDNFINDWITLFKWKSLDIPKQLPGGDYQYRETEIPTSCVSDYALLSPDEDICESMVAYITHYDQLDSQKKEFIESRLPRGESTEGVVNIVRKSYNEIELPKVLEPVKYKRDTTDEFSFSPKST